MFLIKNQGVKALENNLREERIKRKDLEKQIKELTLENESLKVENLHYKQSSNAYKTRFEKLKAKFDKRMEFIQVLENIESELDKTIEECRNGKDKARKARR
jgi:chromosome segregation ATPase